MKVIVSTAAGSYESDTASDEEVLAAAAGNLHYGPNVTVDEIVESMIELLSDFSNLTHVNLTINGKSRYFNPANIEWIEVHR